MPPRRKGTITTKEIKATISTEVIKGTISTEEISKADDNVSNQEDPLGSAAAVKCRGRKVAIFAKEKGGADNVDVPNKDVSVRSSKQKALHKILSMDKDDADDCTTVAGALKPSLGETENDCSGAKKNNRKKQGPRAKKALKSIPEDVAMEAYFLEQGSKIVADDVKELCANEEKPDRGKSRSVRAKENDQCKLRTELKEEQQEKESQQGRMVTGHKSLGQSTTISPIQAPGNLLKKTTDCLAMPTEKPDSLSVLLCCTQESTKPESKKDQTLNVRSSTRIKKVVHYNEQTPKSEKKVFATAESKAQSANKRNASAAKLLPGGVNRVKKDRTSTSEETLALGSARVTCAKRGRRHQKLSSPQNLADKNSAAFINPRETVNKEECREHQKESNSEQVDSSSAFNFVDLGKAVLLQKAQLESGSARVTCVKRGRRHQKLSSPQNLADKNSAAFINPRETGNKEECREHQKESSSEQVDSSSAFNFVDLGKAVLLQTAQLESVKFSPAQEGAKLVSATSLEKMSNAGSIMHGIRESDPIALKQVSQNTSLSEKSQDQMMADDLEMLSMAARRSVVQHCIQDLRLASDTKKMNISKGRKVNNKRRALPDTAQKAEGDLLDVLPLESDADAKPKVLEAPLVQGTAHSMADAEPEETHVSHLSVYAARNFSQNVGRKTSMRKRTLQGTAQQAKKQKISELDTLPASLDVLVEGAAPAQNQEHEMVIQGVESQGWNAVDITRVVRSSEKKRKEEIKRKRAMKFDALPVGFGLGISCWSTPPWANQSIEEGEVDSSVMDFQIQSESPEVAKKQLCLQETAMSNDANNTSLGLEDTHHALQCSVTVEALDSSMMGFQVQLKSPMEEALYLQETAMSLDATNTSLGLKDTYHALPCSATTMQGSTFSVSDAERLPSSGIKPVPKNDSNHRQEKAKVKRQVARKTKISKALLLESIPAVHTSSDNSILDKENLEPKLHVHNDDSEFKTSRSSRRRIATAAKEKTTRTRKN